MKKRLTILCDSLMRQSQEVFGQWEVTVGLFLLVPLGFLSFFFQEYIPVTLFVYLQYKFWSAVFFFVSLLLKKKGHKEFTICTVAVLIQMLDVAIVLGYMYCIKEMLFSKSLDTA